MQRAAGSGQRSAKQKAAPLLLRCLLPAACCLLPATAAAQPGPVVVELRPQATAGRTVRLGDVARLDGGTDLLRDRLARLDVADLPPGGTTTVKRGQVEFRLRLADVPPSLVRLTGPDVVTVTLRADATPQDRVFAAARESVVRRLPWPIDDVSIRLARPIAVALPAGDPDEFRVTAQPRAAGTPVGRVQVDVTVTPAGEDRPGRPLTFPVYLDVRPLVAVAVCRQAVGRGEAVAEPAVFVERRPAADDVAGPPAAADAVVGKRTKRPLRPGQVIAAGDVEDPADGGAVAVKPRQSVRMVVHLGPVNVVAEGEAQQEGRVGQTIRVVNRASKKVVIGRVSGPGVVEVEPGGGP